MENYVFNLQTCEFGEILFGHKNDDTATYNLERRFEYVKTIGEHPYLNITGKEFQYYLTSEPKLSARSSYEIHGKPYPIFLCDVKMKRKLAPYVTSVYFSMAFLVELSWISFLIAPEIVPGRAGLLITLCLVLANFFIYQQESSPSQSGLTPLLLWTNICLMMCVLAFMEYAYLLYCIRFGYITCKGIKRTKISNNYSGWKIKQVTKMNGEEHLVRNAMEEDKLQLFNWAKKVDSYAMKIYPLTFLGISLMYWIFFGLLY